MLLTKFFVVILITGYVKSVAFVGDVEGYCGKEPPAATSCCERNVCDRDTTFANLMDITYGWGSDTVYITDNVDHTIRYIPFGTKVLDILVGVSGFSGSDALHFNAPTSTINYRDCLYVSDYGNHQVREYSLTLTSLSVWAGTGAAGNTVGTYRTSAVLNGPADTYPYLSRMYIANALSGALIAVHVQSGLSSAQTTIANCRFLFMFRNRMYVVATGGTSISQVTIPGAVVTVFVGSTAGDVFGDQSTTRFGSISGMSGSCMRKEMYIGDDGYNKVKLWSFATGMSTLGYGTGTATPSGGFGPLAGTDYNVDKPTGLTLASNNRLFVTDGGALNQKISSLVLPSVTSRYCDLGTRTRTRTSQITGSMRTYCGSGNAGFTGDGGMCNLAVDIAPSGMAIVGKIVYLTNTVNHVIRRLTLTTRVIEIVSGTADNPGTTDGVGPSYNLPEGICHYWGVLFIADRGNNLIRNLTLSTMRAATMGGGGVNAVANNVNALLAQLSGPRGVHAAQKMLAIADTDVHKVRIIKLLTKIIFTLASGIVNVMGVLISKGYLYTGASASGTLMRYHTVTGASASIVPSLSNGVSFIFMDCLRSKFIVISQHLVYVVNLQPQTSTLIAGVVGSPGGFNSEGYFDALTMQLNSPRSAVVDGTTLYIADTANNRIRQLELSKSVFSVRYCATFTKSHTHTPSLTKHTRTRSKFPTKFLSLDPTSTKTKSLTHQKTQSRNKTDDMSLEMGISATPSMSRAITDDRGNKTASHSKTRNRKVSKTKAHTKTKSVYRTRDRKSITKSMSLSDSISDTLSKLGRTDDKNNRTVTASDDKAQTETRSIDDYTKDKSLSRSLSNTRSLRTALVVVEPNIIDGVYLQKPSQDPRPTLTLRLIGDTWVPGKAQKVLESLHVILQPTVNPAGFTRLKSAIMRDSYAEVSQDGTELTMTIGGSIEYNPLIDEHIWVSDVKNFTFNRLEPFRLNDTHFLILGPALPTDVQTVSLLAGSAVMSSAALVNPAAMLSMQTLVLGASVGCSTTGLKTLVSKSTWLLSPLGNVLESTGQPMVADMIEVNVITILSIYAAHWSVFQYFISSKGKTPEEAAQLLWFPEIPLRASLLFLQGTLWACFRSFQIKIQSIYLLLSAAGFGVPALLCYTTVFWVMKRKKAHYELYGPGTVSGIGKFFLPKGYWGPYAETLSFGVLFVPYNKRNKLFLLTEIGFMCIYSLIASLSFTTSSECTLQVNILALLCIIMAIIFFSRRPYRIVALNISRGVEFCVIAMVNAMSTSASVDFDMQLILFVIILVLMFCLIIEAGVVLLAFVWERRQREILSALNKEDDVEMPLISKNSALSPNANSLEKSIGNTAGTFSPPPSNDAAPHNAASTFSNHHPSASSPHTTDHDKDVPGNRNTVPPPPKPPSLASADVPELPRLTSAPNIQMTGKTKNLEL